MFFGSAKDWIQDIYTCEARVHLQATFKDLITLFPELPNWLFCSVSETKDTSTNALMLRLNQSESLRERKSLNIYCL